MISSIPDQVEAHMLHKSLIKCEFYKLHKLSVKMLRNHRNAKNQFDSMGHFTCIQGATASLRASESGQSDHILHAVHRVLYTKYYQYVYLYIL